jgi:hypothetical protein
MAEREQKSFAEPVAHAEHHVLGRPAERTLKIADHHKLKWRPGAPLYVVGRLQRRRELAGHLALPAPPPLRRAAGVAPVCAGLTVLSVRGRNMAIILGARAAGGRGSYIWNGVSVSMIDTAGRSAKRPVRCRTSPD